MEQIYIQNIKINKVRHLENINLSVGNSGRKHIILTGKNGSGKTSVLDAMATFINSVTMGRNPEQLMQDIDGTESLLESWIRMGEKIQQRQAEENLQYEKNLKRYKANRVFSSVEPKHVEKIQLKSEYAIDETPRSEFIKYLLDLKMTEALAASNGKKDKADTIATWFKKFEELLKKIFDDDSVRLEFDEETFKFSIVMDGRESFDFNTLSSGYAAVLDIVVDLIIRMEKQSNRSFDFSIHGIVLVDEIETHLHLELQKKCDETTDNCIPKYPIYCFKSFSVYTEQFG